MEIDLAGIDAKQVVCFRCHKRGHIRKDCRVRMSQESRGGTQQGATGSGKPAGRPFRASKGAAPARDSQQGNGSPQ